MSAKHYLSRFVQTAREMPCVGKNCPVCHDRWAMGEAARMMIEERPEERDLITVIIVHMNLYERLKKLKVVH